MSDDNGTRSTVEAAGDRLKHFASRLKALIERAGSDDEEAESIEAETLMSDAADARASDVHLDPDEDGYRIRFRVDGELIDITEVDRGLGIRIVQLKMTEAEVVTMEQPVEYGIADLRRLGALGARQALDQPSLVSRRS